MNVNAGPEHTPHLPPPTHGAVYRLRQITQPHRKSSDWYVTTGTYPPDAPNAERPNLFRAGSVVLDCDLADYLVSPDALNGADAKTLKAASTAKKAEIHALDDSALDALIAGQAGYVAAVVAHCAGQAPTVTVSSGYGVHCYLWLYDGQGYDVERETARVVNTALIDRINSAVGFRLADPAACDAGSRILRIPGTTNTKNPAKPRPVRILFGDPSYRFDLRTLATAFQVPASMVITGAPRAAAGTAAAHLPTAADQPPAPAKSRKNAPSAEPGAEPGADFSALFAKSEQEAREALNALFTTCPFFLWAVENPTALGRESWRGAATNIAAIGGEYGRSVFHDFSRLDATRYSQRDCDTVYSDALKSAASHGPMTYAALTANGDWPGSGPSQVRSPAALRFLGKAAKLITQPGDLAVTLDAKTGLPKKTPGNLRKILRIDERYGKRLRFNEMSMRTELDGAPFADSGYGDCQEYFEDAYKVPFPREWILNAIPEVASENPFHPVRHWLSGLTWDGISRIERVVTEVLHAPPKPISVAFVRCFLIGAVARALSDSPDGVKVDTALILKGEQGIKKSTFFNVLAGSFFCDTALDLTSKDAFMVLSSAWIIEWSEFDYTLSRNQQSAVRAFLSAKVDSYRPPYGREVVTRPRRCVIVGTTNEDHFLHDPTGSRRFWVIEVPNSPPVDVERLREMRDQLWAEAVALYRAGEAWYLANDTDKERAELAGQYQQEEPWEALVQRWIFDKKIDDVSIERVLAECVLKEAKDWRASDSQTVGRILKKLGFRRYRIMIDGKREYRYCKAEGVEIVSPDGAQAAGVPPASNVVELKPVIDPAWRKLFRETP